MLAYPAALSKTPAKRDVPLDARGVLVVVAVVLGVGVGVLVVRGGRRCAMRELLIRVAELACAAEGFVAMMVALLVGVRVAPLAPCAATGATSALSTSAAPTPRPRRPTDEEEHAAAAFAVEVDEAEVDEAEVDEAEVEVGRVKPGMAGDMAGELSGGT